MKSIETLQKHIGVYVKTKEIYKTYKKSPSGIYSEKDKELYVAYRNAKMILNVNKEGETKTGKLKYKENEI